MIRKEKKSTRGSLAIAFLFIIILTIAAAEVLLLSWSGATKDVARLKRLYARYYAEAAMFEAVNRFMVLYPDAAVPGSVWNITAWPLNTDVALDIDGVETFIYITRPETPTASGRYRYKVNAKVEYTGTARPLKYFRTGADFS